MSNSSIHNCFVRYLVGAIMLCVVSLGSLRAAAPVERGPLPKLPPLKPLFDYPIRDTSICVGHEGAYYLTGTTGYPDWWAVTGDIQVWRSEDLKTWAPVVQKPRNRTVVWNVVSIGCSHAKC